MLSTECKLWDLSKRQEIVLPLTGPTKVASCVAFSPDGDHVAWGGENESRQGEIRIWSLNKRRQTLLLKGEFGHVISVAFSHDGKLLAAGNGDKIIRLYEMPSGREVGVLSGHPGRVHCVMFAPDDRRLVSSGQHATIKLWNLATHQEVLTLTHRSHVWSVDFSPDGRRIASAGVDGTGRVWDGTRAPQ